MIWFVLWCAIAYFAATGMFTGFMRPESPGEWFFNGLFYVLLLAVAAVCCGGCAYGVGALFPQTAVEGPRYQLAAIRDKDGVQGQFFLGSGTIESRPYYFYYRQMRDGGLRPGKVAADSGTTVYEQDNRADAELIVWDWKTTSPLAWLVSIPHDGESHSYDFYVPKGTVKRGYAM